MTVGGIRLAGEAALGRRMVRATGAVALVALSVLGVWASTASAAPLSMTFTEGRANVGVQLSDDPLFEAPDTAPFEAEIDPGSGEIENGDLEVPPFSTFIEDPIDADVTVDFEIGPIDGSFNQATGKLTLTGVAGGTLTANGSECTVSTNPAVLTLTTTEDSGGANPRFGMPFAAGLTGAGAIAVQWVDMQATAVNPGDSEEVTFCQNVEDEIEGPGGVWLEQKDLVPPSAPQLTSTDPGSPNPSGTLRIRGAAEAGSTVSLYAGAACAGTPVASGSADELGSPGLRVEVAEGTTAAFSATATDAAGNASACSAPISYTRVLKQADPPAVPACVVPNMIGKKLRAAKRRIRAANCKVGKVLKPKRLHGQKRRVLVVRSSSPAAGARPANGRVHLKLGPKPQESRR